MAPKKQIKINLLGIKRLSKQMAQRVIDALPAEVFDEGVRPDVDYDQHGALLALYTDDLRLTIELPLVDGGTHQWRLCRPQGLWRKCVCFSWSPQHDSLQAEHAR